MTANTTGTTLDPSVLAPTVSDMLTAFGKAINGSFSADAFVRHELTQLVEDIQNYNALYRSKALSARDAQDLINGAIEAIPNVIATGAAIREDSVKIALNAAMQVLSQAIQTTLKAVFAGFAFTL
jgi:hypothetical protein